jgi:hypothetical protein
MQAAFAQSGITQVQKWRARARRRLADARRVAELRTRRLTRPRAGDKHCFAEDREAINMCANDWASNNQVAPATRAESRLATASKVNCDNYYFDTNANHCRIAISNS